MRIRKALPADRPALFALWNDSCLAGEVVYKPLNDEAFARLFERNPNYDGTYDFVCEENGEIVECPERTGMWAWKHPHTDGTTTYTRLAGHVTM